MYFSFKDVSKHVHFSIRVACIYFIRNKLDGGLYVGSTLDFYKRMKQHQSRLSRGKGSNPLLQRAVTRHGLDNFEVTIWEQCEPDLLFAQETYWINLLQPKYNLSKYPVRGGMTCPHTDAAKAKMRAARLGKPLSPAHAAKSAVAAKGRIRSLEERRKQVQNNPCRKPVLCVTTGELYESANDAARKLQLHATTIIQVCKGRIKTTGGLVFSYPEPTGS